MKNILIGLSIAIATVVCSNAPAMPLCAPPLHNQCVKPQWGEVNPSGVDSLNANPAGPATATAPNERPQASTGIIRMTTAAYAVPKRGLSEPPKLVVDNGQKFELETRSLIAAIDRASFDKDGRVEAGAEAIAAAAAKLRDVSVGYQLNLYIKTQGKLQPDAASKLGSKVTSVNELLLAPPR